MGDPLSADSCFLPQSFGSSGTELVVTGQAFSSSTTVPSGQVKVGFSGGCGGSGSCGCGGSGSGGCGVSGCCG